MGANKIQKMTKFEINNCRKNISFYKDQIKKNKNSRDFYAEQIELMHKKLEELKQNIYSGKPTEVG